MTTTIENERPGRPSGEAPGSAWIPISEKMPRANRRVLVVCEIIPGNAWRAIAKWTDGKSWDASMWDDQPEEWWDKDGDKCYVPEGWWEEPIEVEQVGKLENVTHWMPLPPLPNAKLT